MLSLGPLAFAAPWVLLGLVAVPAIWWLLRISPPLPKRVRFPAIRLLIDLTREQETPAHTPLWLLLLRSLLAIIIVLALASPLWNPAPDTTGSGPLLIVVDNGWAAAGHWRQRSNTLSNLIASAKRDDRLVLVTGTAPTTSSPALDYTPANDAAALARALTPMPLTSDRADLLTQLKASPALKKKPQIVWLSDGIDYGHANVFATGLGDLASDAGVELIEPRPEDRPLALLPPAIEGDAFTATILRAAADTVRSGSVHAVNAYGGVLGSAPFTLDPGATEATASIKLPLDLRNKVARIEIAGEASAGATSLIDERWRRRTVGLVSGSPIGEGQQLLSDLYYLDRAIGPYAVIRHATDDNAGSSQITDLIASPLSVLILADIGNLTMMDRQALTTWVQSGGVLVRFAGPKLTSLGQTLISDQLMPVPLRMGGRALGGALSWTTPQHLAPFELSSPFAGLDVPDDVTVTQQVLAEPTIDLGSHTWARLEDGTPLVTAAKRNKGLVVLFHVTANTSWSNLPLSGLYVDMLRRIIAMSQGVSVTETKADGSLATLSPVRTLDGFGHLGAPPPMATPVPAAHFDETPASPRHPPGLYGPSDDPRALNLARPGMKLATLGSLSDIKTRHIYAESAEMELRAPLLALGLLLIIIDGIAALYVTGLFDATPIRRRRRLNLLPVIAAIIAATALVHPSPARADETADNFALEAATNTRLAYVLTGDSDVDAVSRTGLEGLSQVLRARTSFDAAPPTGVDISHDELTFFPLLYWPMTAGQDNLSPETLTRINNYMEHGGTILFDTRDQDRALSGVTSSGQETLQRLIGKLDLPTLVPVPGNHVLTKSFYLIKDFPGRWAGGALWVENSNALRDPQGGRSNDGVSAIIVGSNDYAAAWARDAAGRPMFPCEPGGERQREQAFRFGVNLVMYTLTGNYKSDQVHIPALLQRLGN